MYAVEYSCTCVTVSELTLTRLGGSEAQPMTLLAILDPCSETARLRQDGILLQAKTETSADAS